jgi:nucleotide-binding universal stress UspA family protein
MSPFAPQSILCGVDFSPVSETALGYASLLSKAYGAALTVLHSHHVELPAYLAEEQWAALQRELQAAAASAEQHLREFATHVLGAAVGAAQYAALDAPPVDGLLQAVEERHPDLVVLGSHGHARLSQFLLGSVSAGVLREITVPLLVTRARADADPTAVRIKHILCPINYTPAATAGLQVAASLAGRLGARLSLVHSLENGGDSAAERERLCQWVPEQVQVDCTWETAPVVKGPAAEGIVHTAVEMGADLIVLGGKHRPLLTASVLGATTERVVRHAACPVLTVPTP